MIYLIIAGVFAVGYSGYRFVQYRKTMKLVKEKFEGMNDVEVVNYAFKSALFNSIMGGLSLSFVVSGADDITLKALYLAITGMFIGNVFDAYALRRVIFTKTSMYIQGKTVRYQSIESIEKRKYSKKSLLTTQQKEQFVIPQVVVDKIQELSNKKKK